MGTG
ncbi:hypothetical protein CARUB_v100073760mg, partial [Capsella rubella]|jgi:hypothetical protein